MTKDASTSGRSLYSTLSRYRDTQNRTPTEDFSTEALADLLNRLPQKTLKEFVSEQLLPKSAKDAFSRRVGSSSLEWSTQNHLEKSCRPDIILRANGDIVLLVENKIGSVIAIREGQRSRTDQLNAYKDFLHKQGKSSHWSGALVLLTHSCFAPDHFRFDQDRGIWQRTCRWYEIYDWLNAQKGREFVSGELQFLMSEFGKFLEEKRMSSGPMKICDLKGIEEQEALQRRVQMSFDQIYEKIKDEHAGLMSKRRRSRRSVRYEPGSVYDWDRLARQYSGPDQGWYLCWGIILPGAEWPAHLQGKDSRMYVAVLTDDIRKREPPAVPKWKPISDSWCKGAMADKKISASEQTELTSVLADWMCKQIEAVEPVLKGAKKKKRR